MSLSQGKEIVVDTRACPLKGIYLVTLYTVDAKARCLVIWFGGRSKIFLVATETVRIERIKS